MGAGKPPGPAGTVPPCIRTPINREAPMTLPQSLLEFRRAHPPTRMRVHGAWWEVIDSGTGQDRGASSPRECMLLLPGTLGTGEIFWQQFQALGGKMRMVALTYPAVPSAERYADGAAAILKRLELKGAHVLGSSLGGFTAQLMALRHPGLVQRLFVCNSLISRIPSPTPPEALRAQGARAMHAARLARLDGWPESDEGLRLAKTVIAEQGWRMISPRHLKARVLALQEATPIPPLPLDDARIVTVECDDDPIIPPPVRAEVRARYPGASQHRLPSGGHFPYISRASDFTAILRTELGL